MGRSSKPLRFLLTDPAMAKWPEFVALADQGHTVSTDVGHLPDSLDALHTYDVVLGPNCWRMEERLRQYLELAIKEARKIRYPKEAKA